MRLLLTARGAFPRQGTLWVAACLVLALTLAVLTAAAVLRSTEYDENYSIFVTGGDARPAWPTTVFTPAEARAPFEARTGLVDIARLLRETDVHPPLYFWALAAWRQVTGDGLLALRAFSILFSTGAVAVWMAAAWRAGLPPLAVGVATTLAYGFGYTGHLARGFALAHLLVALTVLAAIEASRRSGRAVAPTGRAPPGTGSLTWTATAGLAAGLASFTNYLAVFPVAAVLAWLVLAPPGWNAPSWNAPAWGARVKLALAAGLPFTFVQFGNIYFYRAQAGSRPEQFEPFSLLPAVLRLGQFNAANLFGALPLYVADGVWWAAVAGLVVLLPVAAALAIALRWRALGPTRWLWLMGFLAPSAGLLALGAAFGNTPVELRYLAFAAPFAAALAAGGAAAWAGRAPEAGPVPGSGHPSAAALGFGLLLAVQATGTLGMALHPATQQTYRHAIVAVAPLLGPETLLLVPFGNDGVGLVGSVLQEAPASQPLLVVRLADAAAVPSRSAGFRRLILLDIGDRDGREQMRRAMATLRADADWRDGGTSWRDGRRDFSAAVFERAGLADAEPASAGGRRQ